MDKREILTSWIKGCLKHLKIHEMCDGTVEEESLALVFVPDHLKTQEMCERVVEDEPYALLFVPDQCITQEMCEAMRNNPELFFYIPYCFKKKRYMY